MSRISEAMEALMAIHRENKKAKKAIRDLGDALNMMIVVYDELESDKKKSDTLITPKPIPENFNINDLGLPTRCENAIRLALNKNFYDVLYVKSIISHTEADFLRMPNFGRKSLNDLKEKLSEYGLRLGTKGE